MLSASLFAILALQSPAVVGAAATSVAAPVDSMPAGGPAANFGLARTGFSLGNSPRWNGVRLSFRDAGLRQVNGVSLSIWKAPFGQNRNGTVNGIALGLVGPEAGRLRGVNAGLVGVLTERTMAGINLAGGALVSRGTIGGLNLGVLGSYSEGKTIGLTVAGLGAVSRGGFRGVTLAPVAVVTTAAAQGLTIGGLGVASDGDLKGVSLAGVGLYARGRIAGINIAPVGIVGREQVVGFSASLVVAGQGRVGGITIGALSVSSGEVVEGITLSGLRVDTKDLLGLSVAPFNRVRGEQRGIAIGLLNSAKVLKGLQVGLLNHAANNPPALRWLPLINLHL